MFTTTCDRIKRFLPSGPQIRLRHLRSSEARCATSDIVRRSSSIEYAIDKLEHANVRGTTLLGRPGSHEEIRPPFIDRHAEGPIVMEQTKKR